MKSSLAICFRKIATKTRFSTTNFLSTSLRYVPSHDDALPREIQDLQAFVDSSHKLCVLTGAGVSTESGIPDYRSKDVGLYDRTKHRPMEHKDFVQSPAGRQKYWARNYLGWQGFQGRQPNKTHMTLAEWERSGKVHHLVTQNVDELHTKAGSKDVTELHGCMSRVMCLNCDALINRKDLQKRLEHMNAHWSAISEGSGPDADEFIRDEDVREFNVPSCESCGGILKPDVVYFGDNVKKSKVDHVMDKVATSDGLIILGSSLYVWSGYRFILHAEKLGVPVACVNIGPTRADEKYMLKISAKCSDVLSQIVIS